MPYLVSISQNDINADDKKQCHDNSIGAYICFHMACEHFDIMEHSQMDTVAKKVASAKNILKCIFLYYIVNVEIFYP